jgi:capsid portal protein
MEISKNIEEPNNQKGVPVKLFQFNEAYVAPIYTYQKKGDYHFLSFGADNLYPLFLLELYNNYGSPLNKSIINKKTKMTAGFGYKPLADAKLNEWAKKNNLERLLLYLAKDFMIYGGFAIEVIWNREGTSFDINYLPIHTLRIGLKETEEEADYYWYSKDWGQYKKEEYKPEYIKRFDPKDRTGRQAIYYIEPNPAATSLYPIPDYSTAINFVDLDYQIGKFHLNQVRQGFAPSFILNFATGIPTIDEQNQFFREFQRNFKGAENAGKIMITYSDGGDQKPEMIPIQLNDSDDRFILLQEMVEKNITQAHEMPVQLVSFQPGRLGSADERKELMAEFQTYYVAIKQNQMEEAINGVLETIGYTEKIVLNDYTTADKSGVLTRGEEPLQIADSRVDTGDDNNIEYVL